MKLSVIIVNYNVKYFLYQCLDSVMKASQDLEMEVFVVDNNSPDNSIAYLEPLFPSVHFIANQENVGFAKANNQAIAQAKGEYILLLNPDTVVGEDCFKHTCDFMDEHPEAGGLGVKMMDGHGLFLPESKRGFPSPWTSFCKLFGLAKCFPQSERFGKYHLRYLAENKVHQVDVLSGAFMLLRKKALDKVGLLDEAFFMYGEDIDLSYRIVQGGYANYYFPETIIHYKGESTKKDFKYVRIFYEAMLIFYDKHYPHSSILNKWIIKSAIQVRKLFSMLGKAIKRNKSKKITPRNYLFNTKETSYRDIIRRMDNFPNENIIYQIYHPEEELIISNNQTIVNNKKS